MEFLGGLAQFLQEEFGMFYIIDILVLHFCLLQAVPLNRFYIPPLTQRNWMTPWIIISYKKSLGGWLG